MLINTPGLVLHRFKYSDSSIIAHVFTKELGRQPYIVYGLSSKQGRAKANLLQPLNILDMQVYQKQNRDLQKIKDFGISSPHENLRSDFHKNGISLFLAEFLYRTVKEGDPDEGLYEFLSTAVELLDATTAPVQNFHLVFMLKAARYFGIYPGENFSDTSRIFDLRSGLFRVGLPGHDAFCDAEISRQINALMNVSLNETNNVRLTRSERSAVLNCLIDFFNYHIERPGKLKSLDVLQAVFA